MKPEEIKNEEEKDKKLYGLLHEEITQARVKAHKLLTDHVHNSVREEIDNLFYQLPDKLFEYASQFKNQTPVQEAKELLKEIVALIDATESEYFNTERFRKATQDFVDLKIKIKNYLNNNP